MLKIVILNNISACIHISTNLSSMIANIPNKLLLTKYRYDIFSSCKIGASVILCVYIYAHRNQQLPDGI